MTEVLVALIGVFGLLFPVLFGSRIGKWKTLHLIQQLGAAREALPEEMVDERRILTESIKSNVRIYEEQEGRTPSFMLLYGFLWFFIVAGSVGLHVSQDDADPSHALWTAVRPSVEGLSYAFLILSILIILTLTFVGTVEVLRRFEKTKPVGDWALLTFAGAIASKDIREQIKEIRGRKASE